MKHRFIHGVLATILVSYGVCINTRPASAENPPPYQSNQQGISQTQGVASSNNANAEIKAQHETMSPYTVAAAPVNDDIDAAIVIASSPFSSVIDTSGATNSLDDPWMGCGSGANSNTVWYRINAPSGGTLRIRTAGSNYDTVLAAYSSSRGSLNALGCNDDSNGTVQSDLTVRIQSGTTFIEVADYGSIGGGQLAFSTRYTPTVAVTSTPLDVVLLQDETGSMADDISSLRNLAPQIWDGLTGISTAGFRMSVAGFRDYARSVWGGSGDWVYRLRGNFTASRTEFVSALNTLTAYGGNDTAEAQYAAIDYLFTPSHPCIDSEGNGTCTSSFDTPVNQQPIFRPGAKKILLLATDADFHDPINTTGYPGPLLGAVLTALRTNRVIVIGLVPGGAGRIPQMDELAALTGGSVQDTGGSGQNVADAISNALAQIRLVSPSLSDVQASSSTVVNDGFTPVTVTVTLRDTASNPVVGRRVWLMSNRGDIDVMTQPSALTDANGSAVGFLRSVLIGNATISALDLTDNIGIDQTVSIEVVAPGVPPNEELLRSIDALNTSTQNQLRNLSELSNQAASDAKETQQKIGVLSATVVLDTLFLAADFAGGAKNLAEVANWKLPGVLNMTLDKASGAFDIVHIDEQAVWKSIRSGSTKVIPKKAWLNGITYLVASYDNAAWQKLTSQEIEAIYSSLASTGQFANLPLIITAKSTQYGNAIQVAHDQVSSGIPDTVDQSAYANDFRRRSLVPSILSQITARHAAMSHDLHLQEQDAAESHKGIKLFFLKFAPGMVAFYLADGAGKLAYDTVIGGVETAIDAQDLKSAQHAFLDVNTFFQNTPSTMEEFSINTFSGFERLRRGLPVNTVSGRMSNFRHYSQGNSLLGLIWNEQQSYTDVDITNTGDTSASFVVFASYYYNARFLGLPWQAVPLTKDAAVVLGPHETRTVRLHYKRDDKAGSPETDSAVDFVLIGGNDTGKFVTDFLGDRWNPQRVSLVAGQRVTYASASSVAALPSIENPIDTYVSSNPTNQTYEVQTWIVNPFTGTMTIDLTQSLPGGISLISTDGSLSGSAVHWHKDIAAGDILSTSIRFAYAAAPGTKLDIAPATMSFIEPTSGIPLAIQSNPATVAASWPVMARVGMPQAVFGKITNISATIFSLIMQPVNGNLTLTIKNASEAVLYQEAKPFKLDSESYQVIDFNTPALPIGTHSLEAVLNVNGGSKRVLLDIYQVEGQRVSLPVVQH